MPRSSGRSRGGGGAPKEHQQERDREWLARLSTDDLDCHPQSLDWWVARGVRAGRWEWARATPALGTRAVHVGRPDQPPDAGGAHMQKQFRTAVVKSLSVTTLEDRQVPLESHVASGGGRLVGAKFPAEIVGLVIFAELTNVEPGTTLEVHVHDNEFRLAGKSSRIHVDEVADILTPQSHVWAGMAIGSLSLPKPGIYSLTVLANGEIVAERPLWIYTKEPTNWRHAGTYLVSNPPEESTDDDFATEWNPDGEDDTSDGDDD